VLAFLALLDKGDSLGLPSPGYPCYRQILKALDVRPALIETSGQGRWMPTVADVERLAGEGAAGLLLARAGAIAFGSSPMRSITGSNTRRRPKP
jgi:aspartate/methionine/tyrosine aminotransferase